MIPKLIDLTSDDYFMGEALRLARTTPENGHLSRGATVLRSVFMGNCVQVHLILSGGGEAMAEITLTLTLDGDQLKGTYTNKRPNAKPQDVRAHRFSPVPVGSDNPPALAGDWEMRRKAEEATAARDTRTWHLMLRQSGAEVSGAILRIDGDTGTLAGHWQNNKLVLSHFAGERPNLLEATVNADGTLAVRLNGTANYLAARTPAARALGIPEPPDPSRYTNVKDPTTPFHFSFPDVTGKIVSDTDAMFRGKVVLLAIGGSWCPNCHDEAPFLQQLYRKYLRRGLEIVTLSFEEAEQLATVDLEGEMIDRQALAISLGQADGSKCGLAGAHP